MNATLWSKRHISQDVRLQGVSAGGNLGSTKNVT